MRAADDVTTLRRDLLEVAEACGVEHPGLIDSASVEVLTGRTASRPSYEAYEYEPGWGLPSAADREQIVRCRAVPAVAAVSTGFPAGASGSRTSKDVVDKPLQEAEKIGLTATGPPAPATVRTAVRSGSPGIR